MAREFEAEGLFEHALFSELHVTPKYAFTFVWIGAMQRLDDISVTAV